MFNWNKRTLSEVLKKEKKIEFWGGKRPQKSTILVLVLAYYRLFTHLKRFTPLGYWTVLVVVGVLLGLLACSMHGR